MLWTWKVCSARLCWAGMCDTYEYHVHVALSLTSRLAASSGKFCVRQARAFRVEMANGRGNAVADGTREAKGKKKSVSGRREIGNMLRLGAERMFQGAVRLGSRHSPSKHALCVFVSYGRIEVDGGTMPLLFQQ